MKDLKIGAYFYPHEPNDPNRRERAQKYGRTPPDELELAQKAQKLFPNHDQPRTYILGIGKRRLKKWDDSNPKTINEHAELALEHGINYFIIDTYMGEINGKFTSVSDGALNNFARGESDAVRKINFAIMLCFRAPRSILPVKPNEKENNRFIDPTQRAAHMITDKCVKELWGKNNYLHIEGRPYVSIFGSDIGNFNGENREKRIKDFISGLKEYSWKNYKIDPFIVGVVANKNIEQESEMYKRSGADALTGYALLPLMDERETFIQQHSDLVAIRINDWKIMSKTGLYVYPPVVIGWDASPRAEYFNGKNTPMRTIEELKTFEKNYPHSPIVIGSNSQIFEETLYKAKNFIENQPNEHRRIIITAWNEITEGCVLLPREMPKNNIDDKYLQTLLRFTSEG